MTTHASGLPYPSAAAAKKYAAKPEKGSHLISGIVTPKPAPKATITKPKPKPKAQRSSVSNVGNTATLPDGTPLPDIDLGALRFWPR